MPDEYERLKIVPTPTDAERAAIAAALASLREDGRREIPVWWQAGVRESVGEADAESEPAG